MHVPYKEVPIASTLAADAGGGTSHDHHSLADKLSELEAARKQGLISDQEFDTTKASMLNNFSSSGAGTSGMQTVAPVVKPMEMERPVVEPHREFVPTNEFHGKQAFARIAFPIAGHPGFDKGAYHHPAGCCCYTEDRSNPSEDVFGQCICMHVTIACYLGTLCYQPCGIICAHQIPWLGDCPCTEQRVSEKFKRLYPDKITRTQCSMILTSKGSRNQCIFDNSENLRNGRSVPLVLLSHPGSVIKKMYAKERKAGPWRYIESQSDEGGRHEAVHVHLEDGEFLMLDDCDLVLDVSFWKYDVGNTVNFVGGHGTGGQRTKLHGGGRSWMINTDGTISNKSHPDLVLGV